ncbi:MAG: hypothetical protein JWL70_2840 [Acidimicrobiia bacterium]|nr:hypothetical protein [Acidimicrobiia bacterium]
MADHHMLVFTNPVEGREDEFNKWYDEVHLPEVLTVPGFVAAQRYGQTEGSLGNDGPRPYLAVYEIEGDAKEAFDMLMTRAPGFDMSEALDVDNAIIHLYTPIGKRQVAK